MSESEYQGTQSLQAVMSYEVFGRSLGQTFMDLNCKHKLERPLFLETELDLIRVGLEKARKVSFGKKPLHRWNQTMWVTVS